MNDSHRSSDEFLDSAFETLRDSPASNGPPDDVVASTIEAIQTLKTRPVTDRLIDRRKTMMRIFQFSGATVGIMLCTALAWITVIDGGSNIAFGDVVDALKDIESATCMNSQKIGKQQEIKFTFYLQPKRFRMENKKIGVFIVDFQQKQGLSLTPALKMAQKMDLPDSVKQAGFNNPLQQLQALRPADAKPDGHEKIAGLNCPIYKVDNASLLDLKGTMTVWVHPKSELPVKIKMSDSKRKMSLTFDDFKWNKPLEDSLFSLKIPKGYQESKATNPIQEAK